MVSLTIDKTGASSDSAGRSDSDGSFLSFATSADPSAAREAVLDVKESGFLRSASGASFEGRDGADVTVGGRSVFKAGVVLQQQMLLPARSEKSTGAAAKAAPVVKLEKRKVMEKRMETEKRKVMEKRPTQRTERRLKNRPNQNSQRSPNQKPPRPKRIPKRSNQKPLVQIKKRTPLHQWTSMYKNL